MLRFRWNWWNVQHLAEHGVTPAEAEEVVRGARAPHPEARGDGKWRVIGPTSAGRFLHVIYVLDRDGTVFVIHGRDATEPEKQRLRRRRR